MKFKYEILYKENTSTIVIIFFLKGKKKNIIHIRLTNQTGSYFVTQKHSHWNSQSFFPMKFQDKLNEYSHWKLTKFIPIETHKVVPTETKKKFSGKRSKTKKFRLVLTNQQTNEHLNKTHWDWFKFFNSYNLYTM